MMSLIIQKPNGLGPLTDTRALFNRLFDDPFFRLSSSAAQQYAPPEMDLYEKDSSYHVELAVPGLRKENIEIEVVGSRLTVSGHQLHEKYDEGARYHYREVRRGEFSRSVEFPLDIDEGSVNATYDGGILKITLKPIKPIAAKKIAIK
jgi:HSP20 family protein